MCGYSRALYICVCACKQAFEHMCMVMYVYTYVCSYAFVCMHKLVCLFTRVVCTACEGVPYLLMCVHTYMS